MKNSLTIKNCTYIRYKKNKKYKYIRGDEKLWESYIKK